MPPVRIVWCVRLDAASPQGNRPTWRRLVVVAATVGVLLAVAVLLLESADDKPSSPGLPAAAPSTRIQPPTASVPSRVASEAPRPTPPGRPIRLEIPLLALDAPVVPIRLGADRVLAPPADPQLLGWWSGGARPGDVSGRALITGHTVHTGGGVFDDLVRVQKGDLLRVRTTAGTLRYRVASVRVYGKASLAKRAERVFSQAGPGRLVLINCADWNGEVYLSNAVVTAVPSV